MGEKILDAGYALTALRETGYKNTAYALSELLDNSIDAGAMKIDVVALEEELLLPSGQTTKNITSMAVIDNGSGIDEDVFAKCLSIGFGTKKDSPEGIGKFGYGLKGGSISQCKRIEVYTWKNGELPIFTYLDLDEVEEGNQTEIPEANKKELPNFLKQYGKSESGTAILWSKCDKLNYRTHKGLFSSMDGDLSRIFRNFLDDDNTYGEKRDIQLHVVDSDGKSQLNNPHILTANDPTYRLKPNNLPTVDKKTAQEHKFKDDFERNLSKRSTNIEYQNYEKEVDYIDPDGQLRKAKVIFIFTYAEATIQALGGNSKWGQHYGKNDNGISFMRAAREIEFSEKGLVGDSDERNRWWGAEIRFGPELDELFGVDAAKQRIRNIHRIKKEQKASYVEESDMDDTLASLIKRLNILINHEFKKNKDEMMKQIRGRKAGTGKSTITAQEKINKELKKSGVPTKSSEEAKLKEIEQKRQETEEAIKKANPDIGEDELDEMVKKNLDRVITFDEDDWDQFGSFVETVSRGNGLSVVFNRSHKFYTHYYDRFTKSNLEAEEALKIIIQGYARAEDELAPMYDLDNKIFARLRNKWGSFIDAHIEKIKE